MINLLNSEWYKLRKSRSFWVCCICVIASILFIWGMLIMVDKIQRGDLENGTAGMTVIVGQETLECQSIFELITVAEILQDIIGVFVLLISGIFNIIFVMNEFGHGAIRNLAGKGYARWKIFTAKYMICLLATEIMVLLSAVLNYVMGVILIGKAGIDEIVFKDYVIYVLLMSVLVVAVNSIVVAISEISRSMVVGIVAVVCVAGGISTLLFSVLDLLLHNFSVEPSKYWLTNLMEECPFSGFGTEIVLRIVISAVVWLCASLVVGMWHFRKADIK